MSGNGTENDTEQTDGFTGEFPEEWAKGGLWRFNESDPDEDDCLLDSSGMGRAAAINNWSGTSASLSANRLGNYFRMNIVNPSSEQELFEGGQRREHFCGVWGSDRLRRLDEPHHLFGGEHLLPDLQHPVRPGQPIFYLSLIRGNPRIMLYNDTGSLILDESVDPPFSLVNGGWYFIACLIDRTTRRRSMWWATGTAARCGHRKCFPYRGAEPLLHGGPDPGMHADS